MDETKIWQAQAERFFPRHSGGPSKIIHLLEELGVGTNEVAKVLGIKSSNVPRWRRRYEDGGRPIPDKYRPALLDMLREAVAVAEQLLAARERTEQQKPSATLDPENPRMWRFNRRAQIEEFKRVILEAKMELGEA